MKWTKNVDKAFSLIQQAKKANELDSEELYDDLRKLQRTEEITMDNAHRVFEQWELVNKSFNRELFYLARDRGSLSK